MMITRLLKKIRGGEGQLGKTVRREKQKRRKAQLIKVGKGDAILRAVMLDLENRDEHV